MTPTKFLEKNNNKLKAKLEKSLIRNSVTKEMIAYAKQYHQEQLNIGVVSDCNMQEFMTYYGYSKHVFTDKAIDVLKDYKR